MKPRPLVYYVTAHGYGHAARSCDIIGAFRARYPEVPVRLVSDLDPAFFRSRLGDLSLPQRRAALDTGMVQLDAVRLDEAASLREAVEFLASWDEVVGQETRYLAGLEAGLVVTDIPAIPLLAAGKAGCPSVAVGNFGWDWIYEGYAAADPRWREISEAFAEGYRQADLLLHLPFSEPMRNFPSRRRLPVLAHPGRARRDELARLTRADPERTWVLLVFSGLDLGREAIARLETLTDYEFFVVLPLDLAGRNLHPVSRDDVPFSDVLASCDTAITKPGYGIISECAANRKPMIYVDRGDFREYHVLIESIERHLRHVHLPSADLYAGNILPALEAITDAPGPLEEVQLGGAEMAADELYARLQSI